MTKYKARGEWLQPWPFSLRDTVFVRAHDIVKDETLIGEAMGQTVEVHHRDYRTSERRSARRVFVEAS